MILEEASNNFLGKNRAPGQERKATRQQIRQEQKAMRKEAIKLKKSGDKAGAKNLRKNFRQKAKTLRREKGMGLLGTLGLKPKSNLENPSVDESQIRVNTSETQETTPSVTQEVTPTITNTSSANVPTGGGGFNIGSSAAQQSSEPEEEIEETDEGQEGKPNKKSKKWLWIGGGIALLLIGIVLFLVLKNKE